MNIIDRLSIIENGWEPIIFKFELPDGTIQFRNKDNQIHNENDLPAEIWANGSRYWYKNGFIGRDNDLPAIIRHDGTKMWCKKGELHRNNNKPVVIWPDGIEEYYINGKKVK